MPFYILDTSYMYDGFEVSQMRKILIILCCVFLCGCSNQTVNNKKEITKKNSSIEKDEQLIMKEWRYLFWNGDGNEDGYYRIKEHELDSGETITNLNYFDYQTKQEIYLCDKPECLHNDETCTSYLPFLTIGGTLFVYQKHLYLISSGMASFNSLGEVTNQGALLYQMDLDGKNRKIIWQLNEGEKFDKSTVIVGGNKIYLPVEKSELFKMGDNSSMDVVKEKRLMALDLNTKKTQKILELKDKDVIGVCDQNLVIRQYHYQDDPNKYLENNDYAGYDKVIQDVKMGYFKYDLNTKKQSDEVQPNNTSKEFGDYYQNKIYSIVQGKVYGLDLDSGVESEVLALETNKSYMISNFIDDHLIINSFDKNDYNNSFVVSLDGLEIKQLTLSKKEPKEPVDILNISQDYLFVKYDHDGKYEKTWAGTDQFEVSKEYFGLISKDDFFNSVSNYQALIEIE